MDRRTLPLLALPLVALTAPSVPELRPSASDVAIGQAVYLDGPVVQPIAVLEDSRCPVDVRCVTAGTVRVKMRWRRPTGKMEDFTVRLGEPGPLADGSVLLMAVRPEKRTDRPIRRRDYRFDLRFDGGL